MNKKLAILAAVGVLSLNVSSAFAQDAAVEGKVKCAGIAKAGANDCAAIDGSHNCAGHAKKDNDLNEWKYVDSAEECTKAGGKVVESK